MSDLSYADPIVTGEAVALDLRTAGIGSRGIAVAIDFTLQYVLLIVLVLIATNVIGSADVAAGRAVVIVALVLIVLGYPVGFEALWRGRTPGKAAMGLRVVRDDGGPVRFRHAFVRGLVGVFVDRLGLSLGLLALVPMLVSTRSKRTGDFAAGTVVVQERVPSRLAGPAAMPPGLEQWAGTLDLTMVDDALVWEIRQFLARSRELAPWAREQMGAHLLGELSRRTSAPPPGTPPWAYFSAVLAERTRREMERTNAAAPPPVSAPAGGGPTPAPPAAPPAEPDGPFAPPA